jgi:hypothetical protein
VFFALSFGRDSSDRGTFNLVELLRPRSEHSPADAVGSYKNRSLAFKRVSPALERQSCRPRKTRLGFVWSILTTWVPLEWTNCPLPNPRQW